MSFDDTTRGLCNEERAAPRDSVAMPGVTKRLRTGQPQMFRYPNWEEVEIFDSDDLLPEQVMVVMSNRPNDNFGIYVWVGTEAPQLAESTIISVGQQCMAALGVSHAGSIYIVRQNQETSAFWDCFVNG